MYIRAPRCAALNYISYRPINVNSRLSDMTDTPLFVLSTEPSFAICKWLHPMVTYFAVIVFNHALNMGNSSQTIKLHFMMGNSFSWAIQSLSITNCLVPDKLNIVVDNLISMDTSLNYQSQTSLRLINMPSLLITQFSSTQYISYIVNDYRN